MAGGVTFAGRYFDGESARDHTAQVSITGDGLLIETQYETVAWPFRDLVLASGSGGDIRLGNRRAPDAMLALPAEAGPALELAAPDLFSGRRERRRMAALIIALIAGTGAVAAALFIGVPMAAAPLARATPKAFEMQVGANVAAQISVVFQPCGVEAAADIIAPVIDDLAEIGDVGFPITFRFVRMSAPNAFALPGGQIMATSGLIEALGDDQEAFFAVMAHELGHVRARDGIRSIYRNAGLGLALEIITGGSGAAQQAVLLGGQLTQLRYTRRQEAAADETAVEILERAKLNPEALARAFEAITAEIRALEDRQRDRSDDGSRRGDYDISSWLNTHPDTDERIKQARARARDSGRLPLADDAWNRISGACRRSSKE